MNRLKRLQELGQSVWLDYVGRKLLLSGELDRLIVRDGVSGVTSNPTIFQKAIAGSSVYDELIRAAPASEGDSSVLERLMIRDLRLACDKLRSVYETSGGADGFASIEVAPALAGDAAASVEEAARLWREVARPNLMVKIPATAAGLPAIRGCLDHGININITLLFSVARYREVVEAYLEAIEARVRRGDSVRSIASVASFFVSRVDAKVDKAVSAALANTRSGDRALGGGKIAIANARIAYEMYERIFESDRFRALAARGARPQRLLWASTTPKDPAFPDVYYVDALLGPETIDTMTPATLRAYRAHGEPAVRLRDDRAAAHAAFDALASLGIDFGAVADELETEGVRAFGESYNKTIATIGAKRKETSAREHGHAHA